MNHNLAKQKLSILEKIYLYLHTKNFQYRLKNQKIFDDKFIISVGNISTGGTGKTPLIIKLADFLLNKNNQVLICLRGYKGNFKEDVLVSEEGNIKTTPYISGDEAYLIAFKLKEKKHKNFKVVCGKKREVLIEKYGKNHNIILLDDSFQNPKIYKDIEIVLIDSNDNPYTIKLLPAGKYREPISSLTRADIILLTRTTENPENTKLWENILKPFSKPIFYSNHIKDSIIPELKEKDIIAVCGIGNPHSFLNLLKEEKLNIIKKFIYKDHHYFTNEEIQEWLKYKKPIVVTEKDWVRLLYNPVFLQNRKEFYKVSIDLEIHNFKNFIKYINIKY